MAGIFGRIAQECLADELKRYYILYPKKYVNYIRNFEKNNLSEMTGIY